MNEKDLALLEERWPVRMSDYRGNDVHKLIAEVRRLNSEVAALSKLRVVVDEAFGPVLTFENGMASIPSDKAWRIIEVRSWMNK